MQMTGDIGGTHTITTHGDIIVSKTHNSVIININNMTVITLVLRRLTHFLHGPIMFSDTPVFTQRCTGPWCAVPLPVPLCPVAKGHRYYYYYYGNICVFKRINRHVVEGNGKHTHTLWGAVHLQ